MNLRDALSAGPEHGTDRMPIDADRRLRRRLGLETAPAPSRARRVWIPAFAAVALAALAFVVFSKTRESQPAAGFVDISKARWEGTATADTIDVKASSPASATVTWRTAAIVAAPGTRLATRADGDLVLAQGAIQIQRSDVKPFVVAVPMGRVVISAYRSSVTADRESLTILLDDGTGHFTDAQGQAHSLVPGVPLVSPPPPIETPPPVPTGSGSSAPAPAPVPRKQPHGRTPIAPTVEPVPADSSGPPGLTVPRRPDVPCTFKSDCAPGATCRKNEDGASVCMGNGLEGAACWFDGDCVSNTCSQRRCAGAPN